MREQIIVLSLVEIGVGLVAALVTLFAWEYREKPGGTPLVVLSGAITGWAFANGLHSLVPDETATVLFWYVIHPFAALAAVSAFYVAVEWTDVKRLQGPRTRYLLGGFWLLVVGLVLTQPLHGQFMLDTEIADASYLTESPGPLFWIHIAGSWSLVAVAYGLFAVEYRAARGIYRRQLRPILVGGGVAFASVAIQQLRLLDVAGLSISVIGLTIFCVALLWSMFSADFMETVPVARATLVESMEDAVIALDAGDAVVDLNPAAQNLLDIDSSVIGTDAATVFSDYPAFWNEIADTYDTETEVTIRQDETARHYGVNISPVIPRDIEDDAEKRLFGRIIVIRDITEKVGRQNQLEAQKRELERKNEQLDHFASVVSHDLRNPLNTAAGYLELAQETGEQEYYDRVARSHERMETMIAQLLTLARAETDPETRPVRLLPLVEETWATAETDGATLETEFGADLTVEGDPDLLRNIFENLFRNASDHNDPPLQVRVGTDASNGTVDGLFVEDDGTGIPPDKRETIFEHGYTTDREGTGLGLSIVSELVEAHDWTITATEGSDGGARFEITIE